MKTIPGIHQISTHRGELQKQLSNLGAHVPMAGEVPLQGICEGFESLCLH